MIIKGNESAAGLKAVIIVSRFNSMITEKLREGAIAFLTANGGNENDIDTVYVPGAFELPAAAAKAAAKKSWDLIITLGCVIRGGTPHFEYVCSTASHGLEKVARGSMCALGFGLLTCDNVDQARERSGEKTGNKGWEAAAAAVEMAHVLKGLD